MIRQNSFNLMQACNVAAGVCVIVLQFGLIAAEGIGRGVKWFLL